MTEEIPVPVTFNAYKHHFHFLIEKISLWKKLEWKQVEPELTLMGENLIDLYSGDLTVKNICSECLHLFTSENINDKFTFIKWLDLFEFRKITLSDSSIWIIKIGNDPERFIHIHPAKQSLYTIRVRATTLKTVVTLMLKNISISELMIENLISANNIRTIFLNLSPVKSLQNEKGILKLWKLFSNY